MKGGPDLQGDHVEELQLVRRNLHRQNPVLAGSVEEKVGEVEVLPIVSPGQAENSLPRMDRHSFLQVVAVDDVPVLPHGRKQGIGNRKLPVIIIFHDLGQEVDKGGFRPQVPHGRSDFVEE